MKTDTKRKSTKRDTGRSSAPKRSPSIEKSRPLNRKQNKKNIKTKSVIAWKKVFDSISDHVLLISKDHTILAANRSLAEYLGVTVRSIIGKKCYRVMHGTGKPASFCLHSHCLKSLNMQCDDVYDPFHKKHFHISVSPIFRSKNKKRDIQYLLHTMRDVTELRNTEAALRESEQKIRKVFERTIDGILVADIKTKRFKLANAAMSKMLGYSEKEIKMLDIGDIHPQESMPVVLDSFIKLSTGGIKVAMNIPVKRKNGSIFYADISAENTVFEGSKCLIGVFRDITERLKIEEQLKEAKRDYENIVENSLVGVFKATLDGRIIFGNKALADLLEYDSLEDLMERNITVNYKDAGDRESMLKMLEREGKVSNYEVDAVTNKGKIKTTILNSFLKDDVISGMVMDITERKKIARELTKLTEDLDDRVRERTAEVAKINQKLLLEIYERKKIEQELRESEMRFRAASITTADLIWEGDVRDNSLFWYGDIDRLLGYGDGEFPRTISGHLEAVHPDDREEFGRSIEIALVKGDKFITEYRIKCKNGTYRYWDERGIPTGFENGKAVRWVGSVTDITNRKRAEEDLRHSEERYRTIFDEAAFGIISIDSGGNLLEANKRACEMFGYEHDELLRMNIIGLTYPKDRKETKSYLMKMNNYEISRLTFQKRYARKDGDIVWVNVTPTAIRNNDGTLKYYVTLIEDITERKRLEEEAKLIHAKMIHANKMTSIGTLVSGVAHEINNPNSYILSNAQVLNDMWEDVFRVLTEHYHQRGDFMAGGLRFSEANEIIPKLLKGISDGSLRIKKIVEDLRNFTRPGISKEYVEMDIRRVIRSAASMLEPQIKRSTEHFRLDLERELHPVKGNAQHIEQVIINLIINALQSLPDRSRSVELSAENDIKDSCVIIKVLDEGTGIPEDIRDRITEPFFTTKIESGGTGLGLSISYAIIKDHGGTIVFDSAPGKGTAVYVKLPVSRT